MFDTKDKEAYKSVKDKNNEIEEEYKDQVNEYKENVKKRWVKSVPRYGQK